MPDETNAVEPEQPLTGGTNPDVLPRPEPEPRPMEPPEDLAEDQAPPEADAEDR